MLKTKYLHRKIRISEHRWEVKKFQRGKHSPKGIKLFEPLAYHESMKRNRCYRYLKYDITPLYEFLVSKVGCDWNDVYSEICKKIKNDYYRYCIDQYISKPYSYILSNIIYDENYIPRNRYGRIITQSNSDKIILYINLSNKITKAGTEEDAISESKRYLRKEKLEKIQKEMNKNEDENKNENNRE